MLKPSFGRFKPLSDGYKERGKYIVTDLSERHDFSTVDTRKP